MFDVAAVLAPNADDREKRLQGCDYALCDFLCGQGIGIDPLYARVFPEPGSLTFSIAPRCNFYTLHSFIHGVLAIQGSNDLLVAYRLR